MRPKTRDAKGCGRTPGPGSYDVTKTVRSGPAITMSSRHNSLKGDQTPGPGQYNQDSDTKKRAPKYSMLGRNFMPTGEASSPGPGAYKANSDIGKNIRAASRKSRHDIPSAAGRAPGPGQYKVPSSIGAAPKFSMRPKTAIIEEMQRDKVPGP